MPLKILRRISNAVEFFQFSNRREVRDSLGVKTESAAEHGNDRLALRQRVAEFRLIVPDMERYPVIRIDWGAHKEHLVPPLQTVHYAGKTHEITAPSTTH